MGSSVGIIDNLPAINLPVSIADGLFTELASSDITQHLPMADGSQSGQFASTRNKTLSTDELAHETSIVTTRFYGNSSKDKRKFGQQMACNGPKANGQLILLRPNAIDANQRSTLTEIVKQSFFKFKVQFHFE